MSKLSPSSAPFRAASGSGRGNAESSGGPPRWRLPKAALAVAALALAGATVFFYPATASWLSQYDQSRVVVGLQARTGEETPAYRVEALAAAHAYNDQLLSGARLASNARKPVADGLAAADPLYETLLRGDANGAMGRLRIGSIGVDLPIYHGTSDATLAQGVGHLQGTALPVGGASTHSVLTAHRGLAGATLFDRLDELKIDDTFQLEVFGEVLTYRIVETRVVKPENTESLYPRFDEDLVTLVTCTPLGINSHRILVTGERVTPTPIADVQRAGSNPEVPGIPWWAAGLLGTTVVVGLYVWRMGRYPLGVGVE